MTAQMASTPLCADPGKQSLTAPMGYSGGTLLLHMQPGHRDSPAQSRGTQHHNASLKAAGSFSAFSHNI